MEFLSNATVESRHRLIILTDMENEPDDSQTMVHLLMYANELDIEGLIAVTSRWLPTETFPESIRDRVQAYGIVRPNLMRHAQGWPTEEYLLGGVASGQTGFGMEAVGDGLQSSGSERIIEAVDKDDPRPVWIAINAGANTLAQALWDVRRTRSPEELARFVSKIRVYDDSGQDDAGAWIAHTFPDLFYARSRSQVFGLFGPAFGRGPQPWAPLTQYAWIEKHIRTRHGILGALYPQRAWIEPPWNAAYHPGKSDYDVKKLYVFMEGGGTGTWLGLVNKGLCEPEQITWGGWGGRFEGEKTHVPAGQAGVQDLEQPYVPFAMYPQAADDSFTWGDNDEPIMAFSGVHGKTPYYNRDFAPLWRWRDAYTRDFQARMDWCVSDYDQVNHHPVAAFMGDTTRTIVRLKAQAGETVTLDASESHDPDGDALSFKWSIYPEAGTCTQPAQISDTESSRASLTVPAGAAGRQLHVILEVTDQNPLVPLTSYRRVVIDIG